MNIVAIIIARGGSKGVPRKNIIDFCGHPLISWTIKQCLGTDKISSVWVSSDSEEILNISRKYGANIIKRPKEISGDSEPSETAWLHAVKHIENVSILGEIDYVVAPQVTSPLRCVSDLSNAIDVIMRNKSDSLLSVSEIEDFFVWKMNDGQNPEPVNYNYKNRKRRQQIEKKFLENGSFYIFKPEVLINESNRLGGKIELFNMDRYKMFQIDNYEDIKLASVIMKGYGLDTV